MKYFLFIDNFRGFSNTCIPIADVNFLVGENSTGKTSVMSLFKLFSGPQFLLKPSDTFADEHVSFGHFADMVSAHSNDRTYFHIGIVWEGSGGEHGTNGIVAWLCTYIEEQGLPRLSDLTFYRDSRRISVRFRGNHERFKTEAYTNVANVQEVIRTLLPQWVQDHMGGASDYARLERMSFPGRLPIFLVLSIIGDQNKKGNEALNLLSDAALNRDITWIAPIRTKPRRTYDELTSEFSPEGAHTPYLIRRTLRSQKEAAKFKAFIHKVGKSSGLFQDVQIKNFGKGVTAPFEVDIVLDQKALNLSTVGYGVSQSLPVLVELLLRPPGTWFAIQQPEVHLHPRAQAALGDVVFEMATSEHKRFLVETHSDFTIDRFRMKYKEVQGAKPASQVLFFERRDKHNSVTPIHIGESGELSADQPPSYREFFVREELRLLGVD